MNKAITQMDEVTQQNAALVEEAAAAAESLEEQAQNLAAAVAIFKVDEKAGQAVASGPGSSASAAAAWRARRRTQGDRAPKAAPARHPAAANRNRLPPRTASGKNSDCCNG